MPPTRTTSLISAADRPASLSARRHAGHAADEHDVVDVLDALVLGVVHRLAHRADDALDQRGGQLVELGAGQAHVEVLGPGRVGRDERQVDLGLLRGRQLDLRLLGRFLEALQHHLVLRDIDAGGLLELADQPVHEPVVDVIAAEMRVAVRRDDLDDLVTDLEDRDIERAAAHVEHGDQLLLGLVETVGERGRGRLVDDALDLEPGDLAGVLGRLALAVVEVRRHRDDRFGHRLAEELLRCALELHQHARADLGWRVTLAANLERDIAVGSRHDLVRDALRFLLHERVVELPTHEALRREHGVLGVGDCLTAGNVSYEDLALFIEGDHRGSQARAFLVRDDLWLLAFHDRDHGVCGAEVDSNDLAHDVVSFGSLCVLRNLRRPQATVKTRHALPPNSESYANRRLSQRLSPPS